jgi:hypothetical protein
MVAVHRQFGTRSFYFAGDAMSMNRQRAEQICILGFPWEDEQSLENTRLLMTDIADDASFAPAIGSVLIPFPKREIYEHYKDQYKFADWRLSDDRTFDAPRIGTHPFYQSLIFRIGAILDADFFRDPAEVKAKMFDLFRFMRSNNLRDHGPWRGFCSCRALK